MTTINFILEGIYLAKDIAGDKVFHDITIDFSKIIDGNGIIITLLGYSIVFAALVILYFSVNYMSRILQHRQRRRLRQTGHRSAGKDDLSIPGDVSAAIAMAVYLVFEEPHDFEATILTIEKKHRIYSPWSSKIYNVTESPTRINRYRYEKF